MRPIIPVYDVCVLSIIVISRMNLEKDGRRMKNESRTVAFSHDVYTWSESLSAWWYHCLVVWELLRHSVGIDSRFVSLNMQIVWRSLNFDTVIHLLLEQKLDFSILIWEPNELYILNLNFWILTKWKLKTVISYSLLCLISETKLDRKMHLEEVRRNFCRRRKPKEQNSDGIFRKWINSRLRNCKIQKITGSQ